MALPSWRLGFGRDMSCQPPRSRPPVGMLGASLFYGDSVITPAISVLSALEGMAIVTPALKRFVVPISIGVLLALFLIPRRGTASVGKLFGPIMPSWFGALAVAGGAQILRRPEILAAFNPLHAHAFLAERGWHLFAAMGAIVLASGAFSMTRQAIQLGFLPRMQILFLSTHERET